MEFVSLNLKSKPRLLSGQLSEGLLRRLGENTEIRKWGPCEWHLQSSHTGKGTVYYDSVSKVWFHQKTGGKRHRQSIPGALISELGKKIIILLYFLWLSAWNTAPCSHTNSVAGGLWAQKPLEAGEIRAQNLRQMCMQHFNMKTGRKAEKIINVFKKSI